MILQVTIPPPTRTIGRYRFEPGFPKGRYVYRDRTSGRFVSWETVRLALDAAIESAEAAMVRETRRLRAGEITLAEWQLFMESEIKHGTLASAALERGGFDQLTPADYGRMGRYLYNPNALDRDDPAYGQYQFLRDRLEKMEQGVFPREEDVKLYARAIRRAYHKQQREHMRRLGFTEERFLLNPGDSCTDQDGPRGGCIERAEAGWSPLGTFGGIGEANCLANCRCDQAFRNPETGQEWEP